MTAQSAGVRETPQRGAAQPALRALAVAGLVVDAYVHLKLAPVYDQLGTEVTQGMLFRLEALLAVMAAVCLVVKDSRTAWLFAGGVALAGTAAILVTRYVDVPALGPLPDMYDPSWSTDKVQVTVAMLATLVAWLLREVLRRTRSG